MYTENTHRLACESGGGEWAEGCLHSTNLKKQVRKRWKPGFWYTYPRRSVDVIFYIYSSSQRATGTNASDVILTFFEWKKIGGKYICRINKGLQSGYIFLDIRGLLNLAWWRERSTYMCILLRSRSLGKYQELYLRGIFLLDVNRVGPGWTVFLPS